MAHKLDPLLRPRSIAVMGASERAHAADSFCQAAADFSAVVVALGDTVEEIDMNPVIVHADGCIALDALVIGRTAVH